MQHFVYAAADNYPIALLIKDTAFNKREIEKYYITPLEANGVDKNEIISCTLDYCANGKPLARDVKAYLATLLPALDNVGTKYLYCADAKYFKTLTKSSKAEVHLGYKLDCAIKGYEHMVVVLGINHKAITYNPTNGPKLKRSIDTVADVVNGTYQEPGADIIKAAYYPNTLADIKHALKELHNFPTLTADIEAFSLDFDKAGIGTICFCPNDGEGLAFACDYSPLDTPTEDGQYGEYIENPEVQALLREFLETYEGTLIWHTAPYDLGIIIYTLWMDTLLDNEGLLNGLAIVTRSFDDVKVIAYLATNSAVGNKLSLKELAHSFAGNWAKDEIKDIRYIPLPELLKYNVVDGLATYWVYNKYHPIMVADNQEELYETLMKDSLVTIIQMQLTGMPMDPEQIPIAKAELEAIVKTQEDILAKSPIVAQLTVRLQTEEMLAANAKLKVKQHPLSAFADKRFNPNSGPQKIKLVYEEMGLPVQYFTKKKQPSTKGKYLAFLVNHTTNQDYLDVLDALIVHTTANKILTSFIPAFEKAIDKGDGVVYLHGNFNLNGTVSGRMSSSDPNLQNLPSGSLYAKLIKAAFRAAFGWVMAGADYNSLEDYISALTTRDPNKLKVYEQGYDGHSLRAFKYFPEQLPGIVDTIESINSIETLFPVVRQDSKAPTFALTYQGMWITLMKNLGWSEAKSKRIEKNYHDLYVVSDNWVQAKLQEASTRGYVEVAFGLRLRTPLLANTLRGKRSTPFIAEAEGRTAGNALGQSYGLLNNRAANDFMKKVRASKYRNSIKPIALIHDAIYLVMEDNINVIEWVNIELIKSMQWQELPELKHDTVKLGAKLSLFYPNWAHDIKLPNNSTQAEIRAIVKAAI